MTDIKPSRDASPHYYQFFLIQNAREAYSENGQAPREVGKQDSQQSLCCRNSLVRILPWHRCHRQCWTALTTQLLTPTKHCYSEINYKFIFLSTCFKFRDLDVTVGQKLHLVYFVFYTGRLCFVSYQGPHNGRFLHWSQGNNNKN